jgi:hypothetical protein
VYLSMATTNMCFVEDTPGLELGNNDLGYRFMLLSRLISLFTLINQYINNPHLYYFVRNVRYFYLAIKLTKVKAHLLFVSIFT